MELIRHHQPEEFRKGQKETPCVWPPPRILLAGIYLGWAMHVPPGRTLESEWLTKENPETNSIIIKPKTVSHEAEQFSWVPLCYWSPPWFHFPIKSLSLSADLFLQTIHFWVWDENPLLGPRRCPPSCNTKTKKDTYWDIHIFRQTGQEIWLYFFNLVLN